jgi:hypothetical protein
MRDERCELRIIEIGSRQTGALQAMGPAVAAPAVPELVRALNDPLDYVRVAAADALGATGPRAGAAQSNGERSHVRHPHWLQLGINGHQAGFPVRLFSGQSRGESPSAVLTCYACGTSCQYGVNEIAHFA